MPRLVPSPNARDFNERRVDHRDARQPKVQGQVSDGRNTYEVFFARILAEPELITGTTTRWKYHWEEVVVRDDHSVESVANSARRKSRTSGTGYEFSMALNMCEMCQAVSSPTKVGPGVTISTIPSGFTLQPIAENTCVVMHAMRRRSGKSLYAFSMPNAIDGACSSTLIGGDGTPVFEG